MIKGKILESFKSIYPIALIVVILAITLTPISAGDMLLFLMGVLFLVIGMSLFTAGAEMSMQQLGSKIGASIASSGKIWLTTFVGFIIGVIVTISEPDLQILAARVPGVDSYLLILTISIGVGVFLVIALLRTIWGISLNIILAVFYAIALVLAFFIPEGLRPLSFDSGGVTTGPMTVPFIMSIGAGLCSSSYKNRGREDSFGITALCSIGPIIAVLVLGIVMKLDGGTYEPETIIEIVDTRQGVWHYCREIIGFVEEVGIALLPIVIFTVVFQIATRSFSKQQLLKIAVGVVYTFVGLVIFLTGANVGFVPTGLTIGSRLADVAGGALLIPVAMLLGYFIVRAEPAVYVLNRLVEEMSAGAISGKTTGLGLSIGVAAALGLSCLRILTGISVMYIIIPGYIICFILCFFTPKIFVGIAFDSGGVASGTMMSAFVLPFAIGACSTVGGNVMTDAFGCVAFVAMAPIIAIQIFGLLYKIKAKNRKRLFVLKSESFVEYPRERRAFQNEKG